MRTLFLVYLFWIQFFTLKSFHYSRFLFANLPRIVSNQILKKWLVHEQLKLHCSTPDENRSSSNYCFQHVKAGKDTNSDGSSNLEDKDLGRTCSLPLSTTLETITLPSTSSSTLFPYSYPINTIPFMMSIQNRIGHKEYLLIPFILTPRHDHEVIGSSNISPNPIWMRWLVNKNEFANMPSIVKKSNALNNSNFTHKPSNNPNNNNNTTTKVSPLYQYYTPARNRHVVSSNITNTMNNMHHVFEQMGHNEAVCRLHYTATNVTTLPFHAHPSLHLTPLNISEDERLLQWFSSMQKWKLFGGDLLHFKQYEDRFDLALEHEHNTTKILTKLHKVIKNHPGRLVVIGDVHGCIAELCCLLRKIGLYPNDRILLLGDLVAKGPNAKAVIELAMDFEALAIRGNHDEYFLSFATKYYQVLLQKYLDNSSNTTITTSASISTTTNNNNNNSSGSVTVRSTAAGNYTSLSPSSVTCIWNGMHVRTDFIELVQQLSKQQLSWLSKLPYVIYCTELQTVFVHAAISFQRVNRNQNLRWVQRQKAVLLYATSQFPQNGKFTERCYEDLEWAKHVTGPYKVYFGHDSSRGLQVFPFAMGIDTGKSAKVFGITHLIAVCIRLCAWRESHSGGIARRESVFSNLT